MSEVQNPPADGVDSQAAKVLDTQKDNEKSQWDVEKNESKNSEHQNGSERANHQNPRGSSRGQSRVGRGRGSKVSRGPRGRRQRGSADDDRSFPAHKTGDDVKEVQVKEKTSRGPSKGNGESASSHSENSEDDEDEDDEDEDEEADDDEEESQDDDEEEEHRPNDKTEEHENLDENVTVKDIQSPDTSTSKHAEASAKGLQKKQPYVRQVDLPKEKLSPADLEAKMAAMALKNAQLIEQKKAADQDAAEYREIELKSQRTFEAQRAQQQEIDAARKAAADRKLKKTQGREWDWEKTEDDWNRSRPYTDSMTNPNPGKHSWNNQRGSGSRGRPARGPHPRGRGAGRGGRGGARGHGGPESQKADQPSAHDNQSGPVQGQSASNGNDATPST
ncbi:uncharacterized protein PGTG_10812 [Puccinia graminis f. sp. tritici CRL 75-36-700-3]|uniref:Uncharacterized protein n=1 Tax=Puccinia graminis f. sp. tritici (strain CRL 75-36-700-3 / race SCCL) TaxID=418459 RepID=E3KK28_PUCGT|nr:uncharacterized protein PGTG_10812 [Puccinia graminis f. sp. tritici CRL 75-36-700-3]EFP84653.1 hypothetical protein PGTG_10812 [Puccinia graminis f. sp. tritici CRL 75-36-700-3]